MDDNHQITENDSSSIFTSSLESPSDSVTEMTDASTGKKHKSIDSSNIPELKNYSNKVIGKYLKKFGSFTNPNSLSNKERKFLKRLAVIVENDKTKKKKFRGKRPKIEKKMCESNCKQRIAFDLSYFNEDVMRYVDMRMCIKQIQRCYSDNRKLENPLQFHVTSMEGNGEKIFSTISGYQNWDINFHNESYLQVFKKEDIIYLTSESENTINDLDDSKVYIVGGLLDHNSHKGLSHKRAIENGIAHGHLPIDKYVNMKTLKVLPINHVYSIISAVASKRSSWSEALISVIPTRKAASLKVTEHSPNINN